MRDIVQYVIGVPLLLLLVLWCAAAGLLNGLIFINFLCRRKPVWPLIPKVKSWIVQSVLMIGIVVLVSPISGALGAKRTVFSNIQARPELFTFCASVFGGVLLGLCGLRKVGLKTLLASAVIIGPLCWFIWYSDLLAVDQVLIPIFLFALAIFLCNTVLAIAAQSFMADEIIEDLAGAGAPEKLTSGVEILLLDGSLIRKPPVSPGAMKTRGFLKKSVSFSALAKPTGLYLRIAADSSGTPEMVLFQPVQRKAVWLLLPWAHLKEISHEKIIGHREILLHLKNSGKELVLESPPREIEIYLMQ